MSTINIESSTEPLTSNAKRMRTVSLTSPSSNTNLASLTNNYLNALDQLKSFTTVVADTGEINAIQAYSPVDATTNPSLIYKASTLSEYKHLIEDAVNYALNDISDLKSNKIDIAMDRLSVNFGAEISKLVPGYVSTEVDARLSFDTHATVARAHRIIKMYKELGVDKSRILIKIASTYEGIRAGEILEKEGIQCNLTLLFSPVQAAACAEAGITLISPFVGRILDWYKAKTGKTYSPTEDPGVVSVTNIYNYMRYHKYKTIVMGASFRNTDQILALAGCDRLTIAPSLLQELRTLDRPVIRQLHHPSSDLNTPNNTDLKVPNPYPHTVRIQTDEVSFRFAMNEDAMSTEKLAEGIRGFSSDLRKLEELVLARLESVEGRVSINNE